MLSSTKQYLIIFFKGFLIGLTDIVPGISGGTMALILGVYHKVINAIASLNTKWLLCVISLKLKKSAKIIDYGLIAPLTFGILFGIFFFTKVVPLMMFIEKFTLQVFSLFFGLILYTVVSIIRNNFNYSLKDYIIIIAGFSLGMCLLIFGQLNSEHNFFNILVSGVLSATAMILPGISGALILILLGKYVVIFTAIANLKVSILFPFFCGVLLSLLATAKIIAVMLKKFPEDCLNFINGILVSSLIILWPFQSRSIDNKLQAKFESFHLPHNFSDALMAIGFIVLAFLLLSSIKISISNKAMNETQ